MEMIMKTFIAALALSIAALAAAVPSQAGGDIFDKQWVQDAFTQSDD